jgi:hypothetical protein
LPGGAPVVVAGCAGQRLQGGQQRLAVLGGQPEPAEQAAVGLAAVGEVPPGLPACFVGLQGGFAVGGDLVRHPPAELVRVHPGGDRDQVRLGLGQRRRIDPVDQPGQHRCLRRGEPAVQHRGGDLREVAQQAGGAQLRAGDLRRVVLHRGEPAGDRPGLPVVGVGDGPAGERLEPAGRGGQPALQPGELRRHRRDPLLQPTGVELVETFCQQRVDQRRQALRWSGSLSGSCQEPIRRLRQNATTRSAVEKVKSRG